MRVFRLNQRRIALVCAIVLVVLSVVTVLRQQGFFTQPRNTSAADQVASDKKTDEIPRTNLSNDNISNKTPAVTDHTTASEQPKSNPQPESKPITETSTPDTNAYSHVVQAGDSYTTIARSAISNYAATHNLAVSPDQALTAEVALTNAAGAPDIDIDQQITISNDAIKQTLQTADIDHTSTSQPTTQRQTNSIAPAIPSTQPSSADVVTIAKAGDSYTAVARSAISDYATSQKISLSAAQLIAAETFLTEQAGAPLLNEGQAVTIARKDIASAIAKAQALTAEEQAAWQIYV